MSYVNIKVHGVWGTKYRDHVISDDLRLILCNHIKENANKKGIYIDTINGHTDHLHSLMNLKPDLSIATQMQLIKGESAHWINKNKLTSIHFGWADEYFAESVTPGHLEGIRAYIRNQQEHHRKMTWEEEYNERLKRFNLLKG